MVARGKVFVREFHLSEAVVLVNVGPGDPKDEVGLEVGKNRRESPVEGGQIILATDPARQGYIAVAGFFGGGVVFAHMNGVGEDGIVAPKVSVVGIALMGIRIDNEYVLGRATMSPQVFDRDCNIVENAEAQSAIGKGVVGAAGQIGGEAVLESGQSGGDRASSFQHGAFEQLALRWEPEAVAVVSRQPVWMPAGIVLTDRVEVGFVVGAFNIRSREDHWLEDLNLIFNQLMGARELLHWEGVTVWERDKVVGMVEAAHRTLGIEYQILQNWRPRPAGAEGVPRI